MKLSKEKLQEIIREELKHLIKEGIINEQELDEANWLQNAALGTAMSLGLGVASPAMAAKPADKPATSQVQQKQQHKFADKTTKIAYGVLIKFEREKDNSYKINGNPNSKTAKKFAEAEQALLDGAYVQPGTNHFYDSAIETAKKLQQEKSPKIADYEKAADSAENLKIQRY